MRNALAWTWFVVVQIISLIAMVAGWFVLIPFCLAQAWTLSTLSGSIKDGRPIDHWNAGWLRAIWDNPEDGVSGAQALIWVNGQLATYMPNAWPSWRAYCWSAWRNSADALKYRFSWDAGPFKQWTLFGRPQHAGWQGENGSRVPVLSL